MQTTKLLVKMIFGSHLYGTNVATSDEDYKGIFVPNERDLLLGTVKETITTTTRPHGAEKNSHGDIDIELFSLKQYFKLLLGGQTVALTMLFCPEKFILETSPEWAMIVANRQHWLHSGVSAFAGYCRTQANKYGIKGSRVSAARKMMMFLENKCALGHSSKKLSDFWDELVQICDGEEHCDGHLLDPHTQCRMLGVCDRKVQEHVTIKTAYGIYRNVFEQYGQRALAAENQQNIDWKALMHAVRVSKESQELLLTHHITYPRPEAELLLKIRKGEMLYQEVADIIEQGLIGIEEASARSSLPKEPRRDLADDFVYTVYRASMHF